MVEVGWTVDKVFSTVSTNPETSAEAFDPVDLTNDDRRNRRSHLLLLSGLRKRCGFGLAACGPNAFGHLSPFTPHVMLA